MPKTRRKYFLDIEQNKLDDFSVLLHDIRVSSLLNVVKNADEQKIDNRSKRDITIALRTLSEIKNHNTSNPTVYANLINQFVEQLNQKNVKEWLRENEANELINFIENETLVVKKITNNYMSTLKQYQMDIQYFNKNIIQRIEYIQEYLNLAPKTLRKLVKEIDSSNEDSKQKIQKELKDLRKNIKAANSELNKHRNKFNSYLNKLNQRTQVHLTKLNELESMANQIKASKVMERQLKELLEVKNNLIKKLNLETPELLIEQDDIKLDSKSKILTDIDTKLEYVNDMINKLDIKCLQENMYENVKGNLLQSIISTLENSSEYKALKQYQPSNENKKDLIGEYILGIDDAKNLDMLINNVRVNPKNKSTGLTMRENTGMGNFIYSLFHHGAHSRTDELAKRLEHKLKSIIKAQVKLHSKEKQSAPSMKR